MTATVLGWGRALRALHGRGSGKASSLADDVTTTKRGAWTDAGTVYYRPAATAPINLTVSGERRAAGVLFAVGVTPHASIASVAPPPVAPLVSVGNSLDRFSSADGGSLAAASGLTWDAFADMTRTRRASREPSRERSVTIVRTGVSAGL